MDTYTRMENLANLAKLAIGVFSKWFNSALATPALLPLFVLS